MRIITTKTLHQGDTFDVRIDDPTVRAGNAVSIFRDDVRVALGRVGEAVRADREVFVDPHRASQVSNIRDMGKNVRKIRVETIFGDGDE